MLRARAGKRGGGVTTANVTLRIIDGSDRGRTFESLPTPVTVGREEGNSVQLNDERVSRFHIKIQEDRDKLVITDLASTNGTKVNGEEIQVRILRHGDIINVGRSTLIYGSEEQIAHRLAALRGAAPPPGLDDEPRAGLLLDDELNWANNSDLRSTLHSLTPPELPEGLSPGQAAQFCEVLEYLHIRIRDLMNSVQTRPEGDHISLDFRQWQNLIDIQARLAKWLRSIGEPSGEG